MGAPCFVALPAHGRLGRGSGGRDRHAAACSPRRPLWHPCNVLSQLGRCPLFGQSGRIACLALPGRRASQSSPTQVGLDSSVSTWPVLAMVGVGRPVCEEHINAASVRSFHDVVFAIHPDDHEAGPGRAASLTKPQQPGAGHRRARYCFRAAKGHLLGGANTS